MLARLYEAIENAKQMKGEEKVDVLVKSMGETAEAVYQQATTFADRLYKSLDEDFNTAQALATAFELARAVNRFSGHKKAKKRGGPLAKLALQAFAHFTQSLNLLGDDPQTFQEEVKQKRVSALGLNREDIEQSLINRQQARDNKDWTQADQIRDELEAKGVLVMDCVEGMMWRLKL